MGKHVFTIFVGVIVAAILFWQLFTFQVDTGKGAVKLNLGKPVSEPGPGLHVQWPHPIQTVHVYDKRVQANETAAEETTTKDLRNVVRTVAVAWVANDGMKFIRTFGDRKADTRMTDAWNGKLEQAIRTAVNGALSRYRFDELIASDPNQVKYDALENEALAAANGQAAEYGVKIVMLKIKRLELPESVRQNVYNRMGAERSREAASIGQRGETEASVIRARAELYRDTIVAQAKAEAANITSRAEADAAQHKEFSDNPELAIFLTQLKALREISRDDATLVFDPSIPPFNLLRGTASPSPVKTTSNKN